MNGTAGPAVEIRDLVVRYGGVTAVDGLTLDVRAGEQLTLLGPSGSGKSSVLRAVAGLETPAAGAVRILGRTVFDAASRTNDPPERRGVSMVFQSYAIWPHLTVLDNVAYPLQVRGQPSALRQARAREALAMVGIEELAGRPATALSGGQQQRVALARALVFEPRVVLFDEPMSNLDARLRARTGQEIKLLQARLGFTSLYVTHDQDEAFLLSDRIVLVSGGRIAQVARPLDLFRRPASRLVAEFISTSNVVPARVAGTGDGGAVVAELESGGRVRCGSATGTARPGQDAVAYLNATLLRLAPPGAHADNAWRGRVERRSFLGEAVDYVVASEAGRLRVRTLPSSLYEEGAAVTVSADEGDCHLIV